MQHLATPSLSRALFDAPPDGVHVRGAEAELDSKEHEDDEDTAFSEVEEDGELSSTNCNRKLIHYVIIQ